MIYFYGEETTLLLALVVGCELFDSVLTILDMALLLKSGGNNLLKERCINLIVCLIVFSAAPHV